MKKEDRKTALTNIITSLELKLLQAEIDHKVWTKEAMTKTDQQTMAVQTQAKAQLEILKKQLAAAEELLQEAQK